MSTSFSSIEQQQTFPDWLELPVDLLEMAANNLNLIEDLYSLGGVCTSWRRVSLSIRNNKKKTLPWLMLTAEYKDTHRDFYSVAEKKTYSSNYPEALHKHQCWGSRFGWLVSLDHRFLNYGDIHLLDPLSSRTPRLTLPSYWKLPGKLEVLHERSIFKAAVFKLWRKNEHYGQFLVFAIYGPYKNNLAYSRPGDDAWTGITFPETKLMPRQIPERQLDILHLNGQFYSVSSYGNIWLLCDIASGGATNAPTAIPYASPPPTCRTSITVEKMFSLVQMERELHVAVRFKDRVTRRTLLIEIFKCNASTREWQKLKTLGDYALFIGSCTSISVKASDYSTPNCKPNRIYFCYDDYDNRLPEHTLKCNMGIVDVEKYGIRPLKADNRPMNAKNRRPGCFSASAWVIPNL